MSILLFFLPFILFVGGLLFFVVIMSSLGKDDSCKEPSATISQPFEGGKDSAGVPSSVEEFVKSHKDAYILSWKAGGYLPSASITQTMVENGFNFTNPQGTSFWKAHNMGGVKTSKMDNFPMTIANFGSDAVDLTGTKPGTNVGDNTGGNYAYFKDYNAGIVGKAEFMAHQTLYTGAINNTDAIASLSAIAKGGWADDPNDYIMKLTSSYNSFGKQFQWLDQEAIQKHGTAPYKANDAPSVGQVKIPDKKSNTLDSSKRGKIIELAKSRLGIPYVWGGTDWEKGMDCSGLTLNVFQRVGIDLPRVSELQSKTVKKIAQSEAKRGDLVFWGEAGSSHHVAIYAGENKIIEEPEPGKVCQEVPLHGDHWFGTLDGLGEDDTSSDRKSSEKCKVSKESPTDTSSQVAGQNSAPTLEVPKEYEGKLTLPPPDKNNYAGNQYPMGQCTWGAFNRMAQIGKPIEWFSGDGGNGGSWGASAKAKGYTVIKGKPEVGWAASFYGGLAGSTPPYGHIAVCEYVNPDGSILVSETNVVQIGSGARSWRVIDKETVKQVDFIQGKGK